MANYGYNDYLMIGNKMVWAANYNSGTTVSAIARLSATTDKCGYRFQAPQNLTVTDWAAGFANTGDTSNITLCAHIEKDYACFPTGEWVGGSSGPVRIPAPPPGAVSWTQLSSFNAPANLSANQYYWLIVEDGGNTRITPLSSNYVSAVAYGPGNNWNAFSVRWQYGADWSTGSSLFNRELQFALKTSNDNYIGNGVLDFNATAFRVYGTIGYGIKFKMAGRVKIGGVFIPVTVSSFPGVLETKVYENSTLVASVTSLSSDPTGTKLYVFFDPPVLTSPSKTYYIYNHIVNDAGTNAIRYNVNRATFVPQFSSISVPTTWMGISGNTPDPTSWTALTGAPFITGEIPNINLLILDEPNDFGDPPTVVY